MAFNTTIPTIEEVETLPKYQIAFKNWNPQRYYDELDINKITTSKIHPEKANTKDTLFLTKRNSKIEHHEDNSISKPNDDPCINETVSIDDSNSLMPIWDLESLHSAISSIPSLKTRCSKSDDKSSMNTAIVFSSRFFPQSNLYPTSDTDISDDDNISILTSIEQEYDLKAINEKGPITISPNTKPDQTLDAKKISKLYNEMKHNNSCTPEPVTHQDNDVFFDSYQYEQHEEFYDCLEEPINQKAFHLFIDYQFLANNERGSQSSAHYTRTYQVDEMLKALDWSQLVGEQESFSTLAFSVTTSKKYHKLELLQSMFLYKPIEVIKKSRKVLHNGQQHLLPIYYNIIMPLDFHGTIDPGYKKKLQLIHTSTKSEELTDPIIADCF